MRREQQGDYLNTDIISERMDSAFTQGTGIRIVPQRILSYFAGYVPTVFLDRIYKIYRIWVELEKIVGLPAIALAKAGMVKIPFPRGTSAAANFNTFHAPRIFRIEFSKSDN